METIKIKRCEDCIHAKPIEHPNAGELKDCTLFYNIVCGKRPACKYFNVSEKELDEQLEKLFDEQLEKEAEND